MQNIYDVIVIGGGPAGLSSAIYSARAKYRTLVIEKEHIGGQITITQEIVNYPGVLKSTGKLLTAEMAKQAQSFGAEIMVGEVNSIDMNSDLKTVHTSKGEFKAFAILVASGAHPRMVGFKNEAEYKGKGVAYCATCDGEFFTDKKVFVVGGGFAAAEEAVFLTKYAKSVTILIRENDFTCAQSVADHARNNEKIEVITNVEVVKVDGDHLIRSITYKSNKTDEVITYDAKDDNIGVFVFAGYCPETTLVKDILTLTPQGYIETDANMKTEVEGLYAAGDVRNKILRQVVTAVADGAIAATEMEKYCAKMQSKTGIVPIKPVQSQIIVEGQKEEPNSNTNSLFDSQMLDQLNLVFSKMEGKRILKLSLDDSNLSKELESYVKELVSLSDKLSYEITNTNNEKPCVEVCDENGNWTGLAFHGVPGGHEFTSFMLGLYNACGKGQAIDSELLKGIEKLNKVDMKVIVSLTCTMCPDLVVACQKIASLNPNVTAQVYDINNFESYKSKYNIMSVPCLVINDGEKVTFGKKNIQQLLEVLN